MSLALLSLDVSDSPTWTSSTLVSMSSISLSFGAESTDVVLLCGSNDNTAPIDETVGLATLSGFGGSLNQDQMGTLAASLGGWAYLAALRVSGDTPELALNVVGDDGSGGGGGGAPLSWNVAMVSFETSPVTAQPYTLYLVDTTDGNVIVNMPSTAGQPCIVEKASSDLNEIQMMGLSAASLAAFDGFIMGQGGSATTFGNGTDATLTSLVKTGFG